MQAPLRFETGPVCPGWITFRFLAGRHHLASSNLAENVAYSNCDQDGCFRITADEGLDLIMGLARLIDLSLNRVAGVGDSSFGSVTHVPLLPGCSNLL